MTNPIAPRPREKRLFARLVKHLSLFLIYGIIGALLAAIAVFIWLGVSGKPDLKPWHTAALSREFTRDASTRVTTLAEYRHLEDSLFEELKREVYDRVDESDRRLLNRYSTGSLADATSFPENFNRTFELQAESPRAGVLLVHGLTDSPYVFRALASRLHELGCTVVVLRLPGHGTAPAALTHIDWRDWAAAVRMAAKDLRRQLPAQSQLYLVGFSTGAALAVEYSLAQLEGEDLPRADGLVLLSPAIGVDPLAWLAVWQARLAMLPGLQKLAWLDLIPEYDPYKYNSFPVNAGHQIYTLTQIIRERVARLAASGAVREFPRTLVFQSLADATVSPLAVVQVFLSRLAAGGHELVLFDINRQAAASPLVNSNSDLAVARLMHGAPRAFAVTLITNESESSGALVAQYRAAGGAAGAGTPLGIEWPAGMFSLSHTALPISPEDPIYGAERPTARAHVYLGRIEVLGEQGLLAMPANTLVRLRFNPFFAYEQGRIEQFLESTTPDDTRQ